MQKCKTHNDLGFWLNSSAPGDRVIYHTAAIMDRRNTSGDTRSLLYAVWQAAVDGRVYLTQKRIGHHPKSMFEFIAEKASPGRSSRFFPDPPQ
jgi:hypothetical protein